jgi:hypothetical protein
VGRKVLSAGRVHHHFVWIDSMLMPCPEQAAISQRLKARPFIFYDI